MKPTLRCSLWWQTRLWRQQQQRRRAGPAPRPRGYASPGARGAGHPRLLSPYSPVLHGYHRGPQATFAEPVDSWLNLLADTVPFYRDSLIVCPSSLPEERAKSLWSRARSHLPGAHLAMLPPPSSSSFRFRSPSLAATNAPATGPAGATPSVTSTEGDANHGDDGDIRSGQLSSSSPSFSLPPVASAALTVTSTGSTVAGSEYGSLSSPLLPQSTPLQQVAPGSLDLVVFAANVFGEEMLYDAPWYISLAHRALRPHGVLGVLGHSQRVRVVAPEWAAEDSDDYLRQLLREAREQLRVSEQRVSMEATPQPNLSTSSSSASLYTAALKRAVEVEESEDCGHGDVYFPFSAVRRRWLFSEYRMRPHELVSCYRAMPLYQLLQRGLGGAAAAASSAGVSEAENDFVDLPVSGLTPSPYSREEDAAISVVRHRNAVDPLAALQQYLEARGAMESGGGDRGRRPSSPLSSSTLTAEDADTGTLRVQVAHFVVTCSNRSMNSVSQEYQLPSSPSRVSPRRRLK